MRTCDTTTDVLASPSSGWDRALARARAILGSRWLKPLRENRLVQFGLIGGALFLIAPRPESPRDIAIQGDRLAALRAAEANRAGVKALAPDLAHDVDQRALEDEILYREGLRLGLAQNDGIVRQRVVQKVLFLAEEMAGASRPPTDGELRAFFEKNRARWAVAQEVRFVHVFASHRDKLSAWMDDGHRGEPPVSEPSPVAAEASGDRSQLAMTFGAGFADGVLNAPMAEWSGPIESAFGWHLVRVEERKAARPARFEDVRTAVVEAFSVARREEATASFLDAAFRRYHVTVDGTPVSGFTPSRRLAFRSVASGED
jgi:hypothetical protein